MEKMLRFYMEDNKWYVNLPEWTGDKDDLQMVLGADTLLDILSEYGTNIGIYFSTEKKDGFFKMGLIMDCAKEPNSPDNPSEGAIYYIDKYDDIELKIKLWLCDVTKFVFNEFPEEIWIKRIRPQY